VKRFMWVKKSISISIICALFLSSCASAGGGLSVGPSMSSSYFKSKVKEAPGVQKPKLDIIVPVFDPGLPKDPDDYADEGIWPELRRAEAARFAYKLKLALEKTEAFGAIRVMPDATATGDLYVMGTIKESDGETVAIDIKAYDISGKRWFDKSFEHEVKKSFYSNIRNKGKDPYDPVFTKAAERLVKELDYHAANDLDKLQALTDLRFGANFSEQAFAPYMQVKRGVTTLVSYPDDNDLMLKRVKAIRIRDQMFTDQMQPHYEQFNQSMDDSYNIWQKQSFTELAAKNKANREMVGNALAGVALIGLAILSAAAGSQSNSNAGYTAGTTGAVVGGMVGAQLLQKSFQTSEEATFHKEALAELGQSIDSEMAPQVVEFEKSTLKLTGSAKEQFAQWRTFLKKIYEQEATPDVQL